MERHGVASGFRRTSIVVADDNDDLRYLTVHALRAHPRMAGCRLEETRNGLETLDRVSRLLDEGGRILLVSDHRMPGMSGLEVVEALRRSPASARVDVVMLTSAAPPPALQARLDAARVRTVERPASMAALREMLGGVLDAWCAAAP